MIGFLEGTVQEKPLGQLLVRVGGLGFLLAVPDSIWRQCPKGKRQTFLVYTHVREDELSLYGFLKASDRDIFTKMIGVSGIGPKLALTVLSQARGADRIIRAISQADVDFFVAVKGLGKKSAQRLIVDLKPQIGSLKELDLAERTDPELLEALESLGFSKQEMSKAVKGIDQELPLEEKIKLALTKSNTIDKR